MEHKCRGHCKLSDQAKRKEEKEDKTNKEKVRILGEKEKGEKKDKEVEMWDLPDQAYYQALASDKIEKQQAVDVVSKILELKEGEERRR